jgi:hypothetical protein
MTSQFWQMQSSIITQLHTLRSLQMVIALIIPDHDGCCLKSFATLLKSTGWVLSSTETSFPTNGYTVLGSCRVLIGIHSSCASSVEPLQLKLPPPSPPRPLRLALWEPFNCPEHSVSLAKDDDDFMRQDVKFFTTLPEPTHPYPPGVSVKYFLHGPASEESLLAGAAVVSCDGLCPPFDATPNKSIFQHLFGLEFHFDNHTHLRGISPFEFARCFGFQDDLTDRLSQPGHLFCLDAAIPGRTSKWIFEQAHTHLTYIWDSNCEIFSPNQFVAPAATVQAFVNGAIGTRLPSHDCWVEACASDPECVIIMDLVTNPGKICRESLKGVHYSYRQPLRQSLIVVEDGLLIFCKPIRGSTSYTRLQIVPQGLRDIIFVAFHSNPIGGHLNAYRTLHRLRLRYHWPEMYSYIKQMCNACPGCALSNPTRGVSSKLVYHFPIEAPFRVLFVDGYSAGKYSGFEGSETYLIAACGMSGFAVIKPIPHATSASFASAIMKIQLRFGLCHTIVLDKDSKFFGVFKKAVDLLQIN